MNASRYPYAGTEYANPHAATTINGVTYTYDNNGNLATSSPNVYYWDYRDRLTKSSNGTATTTYAYDENNSRVRKTILGTATTTYPNAYYNYSSTGSTTAHILLPDGTPIATVEAKNGAATSTYWLHLDHLGGVQTITNATGTQIQTLDYYPYGDQRISSSSGAFSEQRQYIGKDYDSDSDLDYLEARYYSGEKAMFLSQDPVFNGAPKQQNLANPQTLNSYSYGNGNPIVNEDPTGREAAIRGYGGSVEGGIGVISGAASFNVGLAYVKDPDTGESWLAIPVSGGIHLQVFGAYLSYPATKEVPGVFGFYGGRGPTYTVAPNTKRPGDLEGPQTSFNGNVLIFSASAQGALTNNPSYTGGVGGKGGASLSLYPVETAVPFVMNTAVFTNYYNKAVNGVTNATKSVANKIQALITKPTSTKSSPESTLSSYKPLNSSKIWK